MVETKRRAICEMHTDTRILHNVLETAFIKNNREQVTYVELSQAIGRDVQSEARGLLGTARRHIEREHKVVIEPVVAVGLQVTGDFTGVLDKSAAHIRRQSRRDSTRILNAIADKDLPQEQQIQVAARLSALGVIRLFAKPKVPKQLTEYVEAHGRKELPTAETLRLFTKDKNGN